MLLTYTTSVGASAIRDETEHMKYLCQVWIIMECSNIVAENGGRHYAENLNQEMNHDCHNQKGGYGWSSWTTRCSLQ